MKIFLSYICIALLAQLIPNGARAGDFAAFDSEPRLMLYFRVNLGTAEKQLTAPKFGLSVERDIAFRSASELQTLGLRRSASLLDLQFTRDTFAFGKPTLRLGGAKVTSDGDGDSVWKNPWLWVGVGVGVLAISCVTDHFPCSSSGSNGMGGGGGGY
jgi:hypothetical protein